MKNIKQVFDNRRIEKRKYIRKVLFDLNVLQMHFAQEYSFVCLVSWDGYRSVDVYNFLSGFYDAYFPTFGFYYITFWDILLLLDYKLSGSYRI